MTEPAGESPAPPHQVRSILGLVVANSSLVLAILVYMGWSYDNALYGHFHLSPLELGFGPQEYALRSLDLFSPGIVVVAVSLIAVMSVRTWGELGAAAGDAYRRLLSASSVIGLDDDADADAEIDADGGGGDAPAQAAGTTGAAAETTEGTAETTAAEAARSGARQRSARIALVGTGIAMTAAGLILYWAAYHVQVSTFLVLGLLGGGPLLLTVPGRAGRPGRGPYALALVIAAVCALWAGSVYAEQQGDQAARNLIGGLQTQHLVLIYSVQQLGLRGPGVSVRQIATDAPYRYQYLGLRLLLAQSGTYYLLPQNWSPQYDFTYIVEQSDETDIILY